MTFANKNIYLILLFSILIPESCIDPISPALNPDDSELMLVVYGQITDKPGPFRVKLTTTVPVSVMIDPQPLLNADVRIFNDKGNDVKLFGNYEGWYESEDKNLKGVPGNSYTLSVITPDGKQYESSSELMPEVPDIDKIYFGEAIKTNIVGEQVFQENWLTVFIDNHDPDDKIKYWNFEFEETWEVKLLSDYVLIEHSEPGSPSDLSWDKVHISPDKEVCWVTKSSGSILVASTVNNPLNQLKRYPLSSLGPGNEKLHIKYSMLVKQTALGKNLYNYLKQLVDMNENSGGIYGKLPSPLVGNISCCDGKSKALGYFYASSVKEKRIFINKIQHHIKTTSAYKKCIYYDYNQLPWIPKSFLGINANSGRNVYCSSDYCADCRSYGTDIKPDFWE